MPADSPPVVACYCATFLKPEMLHIYRQLTALRRFRPVVVTRKRENSERFPFDPLVVIPHSATFFLRRFWFRTLRDAPWRMSRAESSRIIRALTEQRAQLLHIYFGHIAVHLLPVMQRWPKPTVVSFHGADALVDLDKPNYRAATQEMLASARLVLVRSGSIARAVTELGCAENKIRIHHTGIPLDEIEFVPRAWPNDGAWRFLQAGRLIEKKGLTTSLRAFALFRKKYPRATFTIAGEGPMLAELQSFAHELQLNEAVHFAGFLAQAELHKTFRASHIFLHPSQLGRDGNQEGVPNAMLEAMASGLPVFATRHGGIPEAIEDGVSGVLVNERDHGALAAALFERTSRADSLGEIAHKGAEKVARQFEQMTQARALEDFYYEAFGAV